MSISMVGDPSYNRATAVSMTCPYCGSIGTFNTVQNHDMWFIASQTLVGYRKCPNPVCNGVVFAQFQHDGRAVIRTFPPNKIAFNRLGIPLEVRKALDEATECHANGCYVASAMMLRKTIEEICEEKDAKAKQLWQRIDLLRDKVIIPPEFFDAMHNLRFLGNDAAHITADTYKEVGEEEIRVGINTTLLLIHAIYQYRQGLHGLERLKASAQPEDE